MKPFDYTAVDREGRTVRGTVEAADWPSALALLVERGLVEVQQFAGEVRSDEGRPLNSAEAVELAGYLSQLAGSGLPLAVGLSALADDVPTGRLSRTLDDLSKRLSEGVSLSWALESLSSRLPVHLRQLIVAGARSGRLSQTLDRLLVHERSMDDMTRQFWQTVTYPAILMSFLIAWLLFAALWLIPEIHLDDWRDIFSDSRQSVLLTDPTQRIVEFSRVAPPLIFATLGAAAVLVGAVRLFGGPGRVSRLAAQLPLLGKAWWYRGLTEFSGLLAVFLEQRLPLAEALRLTALAARDPAVAMTCQRAVDQVSAGSQLSQSLKHQSFAPPTLVNLIQWGERHSALADALQTARGMFLDRFELQTQLARLILPPIVFLLIAGSVFFMATGIFALIRLITALSY
jgi:type II secretory pathway component PulF